MWVVVYKRFVTILRLIKLASFDSDRIGTIVFDLILVHRLYLRLREDLLAIRRICWATVFDVLNTCLFIILKEVALPMLVTTCYREIDLLVLFLAASNRLVHMLLRPWSVA